MSYHKNGKSFNAVQAEKEGRYTATYLAKILGCTSVAIKHFLITSEWHHTSEWFNKTGYYDESLLIHVSNHEDIIDQDYNREEVEQARVLLDELRQFNQNTQKQVWENCTVLWMEWSGTRKYCKCKHREEKNCRVEYNGKSTYMVITSSGEKIKKRKGTRGFKFFGCTKIDDRVKIPGE